MMEDSKNQMPLSKKGQREISSFVAQELLYDYLTDRLDAERKAAIKEHLQNNLEVRKDLEKIGAGIKYTELMSRIQIASPIQERINQPETYLSVLLKKTNYEKWPLAVKWGIEALIVLSGFMLVLMVVPWDQAMKIGLSTRGREVILAEVNRDPRSETDQLRDIERKEKGSFEDEGVKTAANTETDPRPSETPVIPPVKPVAVARTETPKTSVPALPTKPTTPAAATVAAVDAETAPAKRPGEGSLFRGVISVANLPATGPKIQERILELGGRKAGEVELGWKKTPTSAYFHFTMPEAKYEDLQKSLLEFGKPRVQKEKHPRVMPDGIIRLILTVEEAAP
jgi:hypothetical protein